MAFFSTYHTSKCVHTGPDTRCSSTSHCVLHAVCPGCLAQPDPDKPCYCSGPVAGYLPCEKGGTIHEARITMRDPEDADHYLLPHEYAVCDPCHKKQDELVVEGKTSMMYGAFAGA